MSNKKSIGCFAYAFFSIIILAVMIMVGVFVIMDTIKSGWIYIISVLFFFWIFISALISKKEQANLPIIQSNAYLIEKTQNNTRLGSIYFLTFALDDESRKIFRVDLSVFAAFSKNEKGLLKYKHVDKKRDHYLSYRFVEFAKQDD